MLPLHDGQRRGTLWACLALPALLLLCSCEALREFVTGQRTPLAAPMVAIDVAPQDEEVRAEQQARHAKVVRSFTDKLDKELGDTEAALARFRRHFLEETDSRALRVSWKLGHLPLDDLATTLRETIALCDALIYWLACGAPPNGRPGDFSPSEGRMIADDPQLRAALIAATQRAKERLRVLGQDMTKLRAEVQRRVERD